MMLREKLWKLAPKGIEIVLVLLILWLVSSWWLETDKQNLSPNQLIGKTMDVSPTKENIASMARVALFGKQEIPVKKPILRKPAVISKLNIKLLGTVVAGKRSAAIMTVGKSAETTFFLGDSLQDGVFLKAVKTNAVILDHHGKAEWINLSEGNAVVVERIIAPTVYQDERPLTTEEMTNQAPPSMPPQGMPPQGMLPPGMLPPGMLPPGMLPPGMLPPGMLPPGMLPPGMLPQGMPHQGMPHQGMPHQAQAIGQASDTHLPTVA